MTKTAKELKAKAKTRKRTRKPEAPAEEPSAEKSEHTTYAAVGDEAIALPFGSQAEESSVGVFVPPDGTLIRKDGEALVYVMEKGKRRPLRDANVFAACGFGWNEIVVLSPGETDPIPVGEVVARQGDLQGQGA